MADNTLLNNVDFSFRRGSKANFNKSAFKNGSLNICMDTDEFYADIDDRRIPLSGIVIYDTETEIFALENPEPVIYYAISTNQLYHYDPVNLSWTYLTDGTAASDNVGFITNAVSSGNHSIIFYKANGSTFAVNTQDLDTTYSTGNSTYSGLSKLYSESGNNTDGTITQKAIAELLAGKVSTEDGKAPQAVADSKGNVIDQTYIKNVLANGRIVTFTRGDGSTFSISTQDTNDNTTYSGGNSTYTGLTRLYKEAGNNEDGTMTQKAIKQALDGKMSTGATAYAAEFDGKGQNIANTYIKSITQNSLDGHVFTITWGNGNTTNIETVDNNTTYSEATAKDLGLVKLYSALGVNMDGTMTQAALYSAFNTKMNVGDTAIAAIHDGAEQQIDTTYIKNVNVNGQVVTFTRGDNSTFSIVTQDTKIDESTIATSASAGFVMLYPTTGGSTIGAMNQKATTDLLDTKLATTATAAKARADAEGQNISNTYIKNAQIAGTEITFTKGNGSTFKVTTQDNNTTYSKAVVDSNKEGLVKLYSSTGSNTDGSITQKKVSEELSTLKNNGLVGATFSSNDNRITMEKGNGSTFKFDLNNTTYAQATSSTIGLTKIYGGTGNNLDGSIDQKNLTDLLNGKLSTMGTAYAANNDGNNQNIANTYIKSVGINGKVITFTKGDGSTFTITTQDSNTTYATGNTANTGLTKLYTTTGTNTDGSIRQKELSTILTDLSDNKLGSSATAVAAVKDNRDQVIDSTYIKSAQIDGTTVTFTKGDGSTFNIVTQDTNDNSTYSIGSSTYSGLTRLYSTTGTNTNGSIRQSELSTLINGKLNSTATAAAANKDNRDQVIDSTYIKNASVSGKVITFTKGDGSTFTITTQDNNTTYGSATSSSEGLVKIYSSTGTSTDGTMTRKAISDAITSAVTDGKAGNATTANAGIMKLYTSTGSNVDGTITQNAITNAISNATVNKAKYDTSDNQIDEYVKNIVKDESDPNKLLITCGDGSTFTADISSVFSTTYSGLVPAPTSAGNNIYLRSNGTWGKLPNLSTASAGITPKANAGTFSFLRGDGTWASFNTIGYNNLIKDISLAGDDIEDDIIVTRNDGSIYTINLSNYGSEDVEDEDPESVVNMSKDFMITRQGGVKQILSVGEYGEESNDLDDVADYGSEDDDEILDHTDGSTQYTYNGSTYNYRLGEYSRKTYSQIDRVDVVNNSTYTDSDVEYNSTDIYAERIKIPSPIVEETDSETDPTEEPTEGE